MRAKPNITALQMSSNRGACCGTSRVQALNTPKNEVRLLTVGPEDDGRRLDNYLGTVLGRVPKSLVYRIIRRGEVRVNGGRAKPDQRLAAGEVVRVPPVATPEQVAPRLAAGLSDAIAEAILYEDERLIIVDKPPGLAVHAGSGLAFGLIDVLRKLRPATPRLDLAHRLDRETSGAIIAAKDPATLRRLNAMLADGDVEKEYLALLAGRLPGKAPLEVTSAVAEGRDRRGEKHMMAGEHGREARTVFRTVQALPGATLAAVTLDTGRTHQIRVHAQDIGHPLGGDSKYGEDEFNAKLHAAGLRRQFLHAHRLRFRLDKPISVVAPLPADLRTVLAALGARALADELGAHAARRGRNGRARAPLKGQNDRGES